MKKKYFALLAATAIAFLAVPAAATPGSGATSTIVARGNAAEKIKSHSHGPFYVVVQQITIAPGGHTGWHTHPGNRRRTGVLLRRWPATAAAWCC